MKQYKPNWNLGTHWLPCDPTWCGEEQDLNKDYTFFPVFILCFLKSNNTYSCVICVNFEVGNKITILNIDLLFLDAKFLIIQEKVAVRRIQKEKAGSHWKESQSKVILNLQCLR